MATEKVVNYTPEQTAMMRDAYIAAPTRETVEMLAEKLGKTVRSVIAKLSRENVYQAKQYVTKAGEAPQKKDIVAEAIGVACGLSEGEVDSLTKANKTALKKILQRIVTPVTMTVVDTTGELQSMDE